MECKWCGEKIYWYHRIFLDATTVGENDVCHYHVRCYMMMKSMGVTAKATGNSEEFERIYFGKKKDFIGELKKAGLRGSDAGMKARKKLLKISDKVSIHSCVITDKGITDEMKKAFDWIDMEGKSIYIIPKDVIIGEVGKPMPLPGPDLDGYVILEKCLADTRKKVVRPPPVDVEGIAEITKSYPSKRKH